MSAHENVDNKLTLEQPYIKIEDHSYSDELINFYIAFLGNLSIISKEWKKYIIK